MEIFLYPQSIADRLLEVVNLFKVGKEGQQVLDAQKIALLEKIKRLLNVVGSLYVVISCK